MINYCTNKNKYNTNYENNGSLNYLSINKNKNDKLINNIAENYLNEEDFQDYLKNYPENENENTTKHK